MGEILTSHDSNEEVELLHSVAEGGTDQSRSCQAAAEYDDWSTAKLVNEDTADWTCRQRRPTRSRNLKLGTLNNCSSVKIYNLFPL